VVIVILVIISFIVVIVVVVLRPRRREWGRNSAIRPTVRYVTRMCIQKGLHLSSNNPVGEQHAALQLHVG
jgi:hypothetical protein